MNRFTNKVVVITGGTSGIGLAAARQFIKEGATVLVTGAQLAVHQQRSKRSRRKWYRDRGRCHEVRRSQLPV